MEQQNASSSEKPASKDPLIGTTVGDYTVTGLIGEGGMGVVYSAEHHKLKRKAALKVLRGELVSDKQEAARFVGEARVVSKIGHPNIIDIFDIGELPDGRLYYVMEMLKGRPLASVMSETRMPFDAFLPVLRQTCDALEAAHNLGIVHRDLKPDNIFLVERTGEAPLVKLLDFGVAKVLGEESAESKLTRTGHIVGTPQYMAPEQIDGSSKVDRRTDLYALGVIMYELATGKLPFRGETIGALLKAHMLEDVPKFERDKLAPGVPEALEAVIFKALAKNPEERYASAKALAEDLDRVAAGVSTDAASWWENEILKRETLLKTGLSTAILNAGLTRQMTVVMPGPQRRLTLVLIGISATALLLAIAGGGYFYYRSVQFKRAEQKLLAERKRLAQKAQEEEERKKRRVDLMELRSQALAVLQEGLKDGDPALRMRAVAAIGQSKDVRLRTLIEPLLKDADSSVQIQVIGALGLLGARSAIPALTAIVGEKGDIKDMSVGVPAAEALDKLGAPLGQTILRKALRSRDGKTQLNASLLLAERGDKAARKLIAKRLKKAPEPEALLIYSRLAKAGDEGAQKALAQRLKEDAPADATQLQIAAALARSGDERGRAALGQVAQKPGPRQMMAARIMASLDDPSGYDLFRSTFEDPKKPLPERILAAEGLGACNEKSGARLLSTVLPRGAADAVLRQVAASSILQIAMGDPQLLAQQSLSWAQNALSDESWEVRESAVALLGDSDPALAVPLLGKALKDGQMEVRVSAANALGRTRVRQAVTVLSDALADKAGSVRVAALRNIGTVGAHLRKRGEKAVDDEVAQKIKQAITEKADQGEASEQVVAAATLLRLGDESRKDKLLQGLDSKDPEIRKLAVQETRAADPETAQTSLQKALKDRSFDVRFSAARELADQGSREGLSVLREALKKKGPDALAAYGALKKLGEDVQPPAGGLGEILKSGDIATKERALDAVAQMPVGDALPLLKRAARDPAAQVRRKVVEIAGELPELKGLPAGLPVLRTLSGDADVAVRSRAQALVARLTPKEPEAPLPEKKEVKEAPRQPAPVIAPPDLAQPPPPPDLSAPATQQPEVAEKLESIKDKEKKEPGAEEDRGMRKQSAREEAQLKLAAAELLLASGKFERAVKSYEEVRKLDPKLQVFFPLAESYRRWANQESDLGKQKKLLQKALENYKKAREPKAREYVEEIKERLQ